MHQTKGNSWKLFGHSILFWLSLELKNNFKFIGQANVTIKTPSLSSSKTVVLISWNKREKEYLICDRNCKGSKGTIAFTKLEDISYKLSGCRFHLWATNALELIAKLTKVHSIDYLISFRAFMGRLSWRLFSPTRIICYCIQTLLSLICRSVRKSIFFSSYTFMDVFVWAFSSQEIKEERESRLCTSQYEGVVKRGCKRLGGEDKTITTSAALTVKATRSGYGGSGRGDCKSRGNRSIHLFPFSFPVVWWSLKPVFLFFLCTILFCDFMDKVCDLKIWVSHLFMMFQAQNLPRISTKSH